MAPLPGPREVRVKVHSCAVAYRDLLDRQGAFPFMRQPTILGHEFAGVVERVGEEVGGALRVGSRVASLHWAQRDAWPSPFSNGGKGAQSMFGLTVDGGYAEFVTCDESGLVPVPDGWSSAQAAPVPMGRRSIVSDRMKRFV